MNTRRRLSDMAMVDPERPAQHDEARVAVAECSHALADEVWALSQLSRHLLLREQQTARHMADVLHDALGQTLAAIRLSLDLLRPDAANPAPDAGTEENVERIDSMLDQAIRDLRQMLDDLRPPLLAGHGLIVALEHEVRRRDAADDNVDVLLETEAPARVTRWPLDVENAAFLIAREAVDNALRHAGASLIRVVVDGDKDTLRLEVIDDGCGIAPERLSGTNPRQGITAMRERAGAVGARFALHGMRGGGTRVQLRWSLEEGAHERDIPGR